ncbi:MAG: Spy/CpxP family protein refolding chaperone [Acidobacteria bacterium]|nr:Spy/CpxP family protein refolding chaperone [Acidobacteriota bacterium]
MKSIQAIFTVAIVALALTASTAFAQEQGGAEGGGGPMRHHMGHFGGGPGMDLPLHQLNLSDDQHAQIKQIFEKERPTMKPLMVQEFQAHQQMMQLVTSGSFDSAKAAAIASTEAQTHVQVEVEHAKIAAQIYQILNSDQKAKVADIMSKHQQMMERHLNQQEQAPPSQ